MVERSGADSWLQHYKNQIAVAAAVTVAAVGSLVLPAKDPQANNHRSPQIEAKFIDPQPEVEINESTQDQQQWFSHDYAVDDGFAAQIRKPSPQNERDYEGFHWNDFSSYSLTPPPTLREVVLVDDKNDFPANLTDKKVAPLAVFNASEHPVDITFIRYAAAAIRAWQLSKLKQPVVVDDAIQARVQSIDKPHSLFQTGIEYDSHNNSGITLWGSQSTDSWIRPWYALPRGESYYGGHRFLKNPASFDARDVMATELCQAMVEVRDAQPQFLAKGKVRIVEHVIAGFNRDARHDINLTAQEVVCNSLGQTLAAIYVGGSKAAAKLLTSQKPGRGLQQVTTMDYLPYMPDWSKFVTIANAVKQHPSTAEAIDGQDTPTVRFDNNSYGTNIVP